MKLNTEALRGDLIRYHEIAEVAGVPHISESVEQLEEAEEEELVTVAADQGWDLGKYIVDSV